MANAVFCTVKTSSQAQAIVDRLKAAGFTASDISVLMPNKEGTKDFAVDNQTKSPEGAAAGVTTGALLGGGLGWLAGIGALAIPGVGPLIAAGPLWQRSQAQLLAAQLAESLVHSLEWEFLNTRQNATKASSRVDTVLSRCIPKTRTKPKKQRRFSKQLRLKIFRHRAKPPSADVFRSKKI